MRPHPPDFVDTLLAAYNAGLIPCVPAQGSVGASGDLAPLAHMTLSLMGEGEVLAGGRAEPALPHLQAAGVPPLTLSAKEGPIFFDQGEVERLWARWVPGSSELPN